MVHVPHAIAPAIEALEYDFDHPCANGCRRLWKRRGFWLDKRSERFQHWHHENAFEDLDNRRIGRWKLELKLKLEENGVGVGVEVGVGVGGVITMRIEQ